MSRAVDISSPSSPLPVRSRNFHVVLTGNPNCGKTTIFNALTGLRAKVGNYSGVTVERKEGRLLHAPKELPIKVLDLPGTYSLTPQSLDEKVARDVLFHRLNDVEPPDLIIVVVDASNLQRNLYFATQVIELGYPTLVALNLMDVAQSNGQELQPAALERHLGVPVLPLIASKSVGIPELRARIVALARNPPPRPVPLSFCRLPALLTIESSGLATLLMQTFSESRYQGQAEALLLLSDERFQVSSGAHYPEKICQSVSKARLQLETAGIDWRSAVIESRYARVTEIEQAVLTRQATTAESFSDRLDGVLTHRIWGLLIFVAIMALLFQSIFTIATYPMTLLTTVVDTFGAVVSEWLPPGDLNDLLVKGVIAGVGAVVVFLPQILLLFLFIGILEDTGYMARAAFLMDRLMSKVGLHGKSFIPMLSSFACAIPGIMASRTIESPKDRLVTILVAPLMSCSARLPVYTVLIAACLPDRTLFGFWKLSGITMLSMYFLGIVVALLMALLFKKTLLKGPTPMLIMELPPYKRPVTTVVLRHMWDRSKLFLRRAGTVILGINIILWFLATYPKNSELTAEFQAKRVALLQGVPAGSEPPAAVQSQLDALGRELAGERLRHSFAGHMGRLLEPAIAPLGFDWKIGIGIIASFAAREVFVSTMSVVYNVGEFEDEATSTASLARSMQSQTRPDGSPVYTPLTGITLMVFYVFALQCVSTVAVVRRETNTWKWPLFQWFYMGALAWVLAFVTWRAGHLLGFH